MDIKKRFMGVKPWCWYVLLTLGLCLGIVFLCIPDSPEIPQGKYLLMDGETPGRYLVIRDGKLLEGSYAAPTEYTLPKRGWSKPPFSQMEWETLADPYGIGARKAIPGQIGDCRYLDLGTVTADIRVETAAGEMIRKNVQTHTFLLYAGGQFYFGKREIPGEEENGVTAARTWRMVSQWSEADPVGSGIRELDGWVDQLLDSKTQLAGRDAVLAAIAGNEKLYKQVYDHRYVVQYISHMFGQEGVSGTKEIFMGVLLEQVYDRKNEQPIIPLEEGSYSSSFMSSMEMIRHLYLQEGAKFVMSRHPVSFIMLQYLANEP